MLQVQARGTIFKYLKLVNLIALTFLGLTAGIPKILRMQQELDFFAAAGFGETFVGAFGVTQLLGGTLLIFRKTRKHGAVIVAITFAASTVMLFLDGQTGFGFFSILPILLLGLLIAEKNPR